MILHAPGNVTVSVRYSRQHISASAPYNVILGRCAKFKLTNDSIRTHIVCLRAWCVSGAEKSVVYLPSALNPICFIITLGSPFSFKMNTKRGTRKNMSWSTLRPIPRQTRQNVSFVTLLCLYEKCNTKLIRERRKKSVLSFLISGVFLSFSLKLLSPPIKLHCRLEKIVPPAHSLEHSPAASPSLCGT